MKQNTPIASDEERQERMARAKSAALEYIARYGLDVSEVEFTTRGQHRKQKDTYLINLDLIMASEPESLCRVLEERIQRSAKYSAGVW